MRCWVLHPVDPEVDRRRRQSVTTTSTRAGRLRRLGPRRRGGGRRRRRGRSVLRRRPARAGRRRPPHPGPLPAALPPQRGRPPGRAVAADARRWRRRPASRSSPARSPPTTGDPLRVVTYERADRPARRGALLWIHGGGMVLGTPEQGHPLCSRWADELGCLVVSVDYRLAPGGSLPGRPRGLLRRARVGSTTRPTTLGVDPERIAVGGDSAGGGLAAALSQLARDRGGPAICFQLLEYPMLDDRTVLRSDHGGPRRVRVDAGVEPLRLDRLPRPPTDRHRGPALRRAGAHRGPRRPATGLDRGRRPRPVPRRGRRLRRAARSGRRGLRPPRRARHVPRRRRDPAAGTHRPPLPRPDDRGAGSRPRHGRLLCSRSDDPQLRREASGSGRRGCRGGERSVDLADDPRQRKQVRAQDRLSGGEQVPPRARGRGRPR